MKRQIILFAIALLSWALLPGQETEGFVKEETRGITETIRHDFGGLLPEQDINVEVIDGYYVYEGDIIVGEADGMGRDAGRPTTSCSIRWPNATIPYTMAKGHPNRADILAAIERINEETILCVVPKTNERDYIDFIAEGWCSSWVGRQGGRQVVKVNGCPVGSIMHEILHASGMFHEQSRSDRDNYVTIETDNIKQRGLPNFNKQQGTISSCYYDYGSIMHYSGRAFSKNGEATIVPLRNLPPGVTMGQRSKLSVCDIEGIANLYPDATGCGHGLNSTASDCNLSWGTPTAVAIKGGGLDVFSRKSADGTLWYRAQQGSSFNNWAGLNGTIPGGAEIISISTQDESVDLLVRGMDNALYHMRWTKSAGWPRNWTKVGGLITSDPEVVSRGPGKLDAFVRGGDGGVYTISYANGRWGNWSALSGEIPASSTVSAVAWGEERMDIFVRGMNDALWTRTWNNRSGWAGWKTLGGTITSNPEAVLCGNRLDVYARGVDGQLYRRAEGKGQWSNWKGLGGTIPPGSEITAVSWGGGRADIFVRGMNDALWQLSYTGSSWSSWQTLGGKLTSSPYSISSASNRLDVFARDVDSKIYHASWNGSQWTKRSF